MVLSGISKKNALDDVFWMALYNLSVTTRQHDTDKFYDVLLPFLTGKPLEVSLVEAERAATDAERYGGRFGVWRTPQRAQTPYVRCINQAVNYLLKRKGVSDARCKQVCMCMYMCVYVCVCVVFCFFFWCVCVDQAVNGLLKRKGVSDARCKQVCMCMYMCVYVCVCVR